MLSSSWSFWNLQLKRPFFELRDDGPRLALRFSEVMLNVSIRFFTPAGN